MLNRLKLNGAEAIAQALLDNGIKLVFGIPGVHNVALFEALRRSGIRVIPAAHEQGAAFMANGYARATGNPGVFISVPGPGLTNSLTPIAEALVDSTPMLGIVTDVPRSENKFQMHEIKQALLAQPIVKSVQTIRAASEIPSAVKNLLELTTSGEPGPCILQVPANIFWDRVDQPKPDSNDKTRSAIGTAQIETVIARLESAKRVGLFVGLGAAHAAAEVCALAEWLNAPVATTGSGRGVLDEAHPLSLGFAWGSYAVDSVNHIFAGCDLILAIGVKFSQNGTFDYRLEIPCPLIHVDASQDVLGKNYTAEIGIQMDAHDFLTALLNRKSEFGQRRDEELLQLIHDEKERCEAQRKGDTSTQFFAGDQTLSPSEFFATLRGLLPPDAILVTDTGFNERLTLQNWLVHEPRTLISPSNFESMGFGIPTAIGAALAFPERKVVAVVGDGGLAMSGFEMMTAVREKVNLTIIVLNNNGFGIIKKIQQEFFGTSVAVDVGAPDFRMLAESIHMDFESTATGISALEQALKNPSPAMLEVKMEHEEGNKAANFRKKLRNDLKQGLQKFVR